MTMGIPVRVLLVEDSEDDAVLVIDELREGGFDPSWERVETLEAMTEALEHRDWDIVIADQVLPRFSGIEALNLTQGRDADLPLILISGHLSEEEAVDAMRAGARDFISKNKMARLSPAVARELRDAQMRRERRQAREQLKQEQEHRLEFYRSLIHASTDGKLTVTDRDDIERVSGQAIAEWEIVDSKGLSDIRKGIADVARSEGMDESQLGKFILIVGEALTNALKHAGGGKASLHRTSNGMMAVISDRGSGIGAMQLPEVALRMGYSTAGTLGIGYKAILQYSDRTYLATGPAGTTLGIEMCLSADTQPWFVHGSH